jgi:hypothetical protein
MIFEAVTPMHYLMIVVIVVSSAASGPRGRSQGST